MTEQQILDKYFLIKTDNVQESQLMIPKLRSVMRKLTYKKWYQNKNKIDSSELEKEPRIDRLNYQKVTESDGSVTKYYDLSDPIPRGQPHTQPRLTKWTLSTAK